MSVNIGSAASRSAASSAIDWSPYLVGAAIGILSWIVFVVADNPIGVTTAFSQVSGYLALPILGAEGVAGNSYWTKNPPRLDYGVVFLGGTLLGGFASAATSGRLRLESVPEVWRSRFGSSVAKRFLWAFVGGAVAMYGARLANGCTSGNGISGGLQLALSGWVFLTAMFASGALAAHAILRRP